jgi:DMSO/TMAO reductase YedYZ molybdopterin-dependent catalytic subunit
MNMPWRNILAAAECSGSGSNLLLEGQEVTDMDGKDMRRPMPVADMLQQADDIFLACRMNDPPCNGTPLRVPGPGRGGTASFTWPTEVRIEPHPFRRPPERQGRGPRAPRRHTPRRRTRAEGREPRRLGRRGGRRHHGALYARPSTRAGWTRAARASGRFSYNR